MFDLLPVGKNQPDPERIPPPEMSPAPCTTPGMEQNPPRGLPSHTEEIPARPVVVPMLPTRRRPHGRRAPLPDPVAVRQVRVPDSLPPYDGEAASNRPETGQDTPGAGQDGPGGGPDRPGGGPDRPGGGPGGPGGPGVGPDTEPGEVLRAVPGPGGWPSQFAQVLAETLAGSRHAQQLTPWTTEQTRLRIRELGPLLASGQRPRVRRIMTSAPATNVLELTAVIGFGTRVRVLALRLERADQAPPGWQCTAIESA